MFALSASVLAQLISLTLGDRIQGYYVVNDQTNHFEATNSTGAGVLVSVDRRRASVSVGYSPSFTVVRLVREPRELLIEHAALFSGGYRWRDTTASLTTMITYGERDFQQEAIIPKRPAPQAQLPTPAPNQGGQTPAPTGGQQGTGGSTGTADGSTGKAGTTVAPPAFEERPVDYGTLQTQGSVQHRLTGRTSLSITGGYSIAGGLGRVAQRSYPLSRGPNGAVSLNYAMDSRNSFMTGVTTQLMYNQNGSNGFIASLNEDYVHRFARRTTGTIGTGIAYTRSEPVFGLALHSIFPTGRAGLTHAEHVARGNLTLSLNASSSPVLDLTTAVVDPRVAGSLSSGFSRDRFSITAAMASSISVARDRVNAFDTIFGSLMTSYDLGAGFAVDGGVNASWQRYADDTLIDPSLVFLIGLSYSFGDQINLRR